MYQLFILLFYILTLKLLLQFKNLFTILFTNIQCNEYLVLDSGNLIKDLILKKLLG